MIIRIIGADFSSANIGTLNTYVVSKSIGRGASYEIPGFVDKNASVNWVITLGEDYEFGTYSITMGGEVVTPSVDGNVMTISIAEVTGNIRISVATINTNTGEEEGGEEPTVPTLTLDSIAYGTLTYRDIFVTNNVAMDVNNNSKTTSVNGTYSYTDSTGSTSIVTNASNESNYLPPYSVYITGTSSQQAKLVKKGTTTGVTFAKNKSFYCAANIKVTRYSKGYCGIIFGSAFNGAINHQTDGWVRHVGITANNANADASSIFIGSASSANLDGYINNPVVVDSAIFTTKPSQTEWETLYNTYNNILLNS